MLPRAVLQSGLAVSRGWRAAGLRGMTTCHTGAASAAASETTRGGRRGRTRAAAYVGVGAGVAAAAYVGVGDEGAHAQGGGPVATCLDVIERRLSVIERALGILVPGAQTKFGEVLPARAASTAASILLVSDIDGTLTGCDAGIKRFKQAWVSKFAAQGSVLVYNTARPMDAAKTKSGYLQLLEKQAADGDALLAIPDALITSEGSEVYYFQNGVPVRDQEWKAKMAQQWCYDDVVRIMLPHDECVWADPLVSSEGDDFRFTVTLKEESRCKELVQYFKQELGTDRYRVSWVPMTWCDGFMISVLPAHASKRTAAQFVAKKYGVGDSRVVWSGDSENDQTMLSTPFVGIAVANSTPGFHAACRGKAAVYCAKERSANGILEGLAFHGF